MILFFLSHYINIINLPEYLIFENMLYMRDKVYSKIYENIYIVGVIFLKINVSTVAVMLKTNETKTQSHREKEKLKLK